ncbi:MAG: TSUP family transporter, partial [Acidobacteriota bacterium]
MLILLCLASFVAGLVDSIAGGGGLILMPALLLSGLPPQSALGTNKL